MTKFLLGSAGNALLDPFSFSFIQFSGYRAIQTDGLFCYPQVQPSEAARFNPRRFFVVLSSIQLPQRGRDPLKRANKRCMPRPLCCSLMAVCGRWVRAHWRRTARLELRAIENPPEIPRYGPDGEGAGLFPISALQAPAALLEPRLRLS